MSAAPLWNKSKEELLKQLQEQKQQLANLRTQKIASGASTKLTKIHDARKSVARILTVVNVKGFQALRQYHKGKKYVPLDLRPKKTRAIRRRLTTYEATQRTAKQAKKDMCFPERKYAIKA